MNLSSLTPSTDPARLCPYCSFSTGTYIPNIRFPIIDRMPAVYWSSVKLGYHIGAEHPIKHHKLNIEGDVVEMVRFYNEQPDLPVSEEFEGLSAREIVMKIDEDPNLTLEDHGLI